MHLRFLSSIAIALGLATNSWAAPPSLCEVDPPTELSWYEARSFLSYSTDYSFLFESIPPQATQIGLSVEAGFDDQGVEPRAIRLNLEWAGHTSLFGPFNVVDLDFFTKTHARVANGGIENLETVAMRDTKRLESLDRFTEQNVSGLSKAIGAHMRQKDPDSWVKLRSKVREAVLGIRAEDLSKESRSHWFVKRLLEYQKLMRINFFGGVYGLSAGDLATSDLIAVSLLAPVSFGGALIENFPKFPAGVSDEGQVQWALSLPYWSQIVAAIASINDDGATTQVDLGFLPISKALLKENIVYAAERNLVPTSEEVAFLTKKMMAYKGSGLSATRRRLRYKLTGQIENCTGDDQLKIKARGRFLAEFFKSDGKTPLTAQENAKILRVVNDATGVPTERVIEASFDQGIVVSEGRPKVMGMTLSASNEILHALKKQHWAGALPVKDADGSELLTLSPDGDSVFNNIDNPPFAPPIGPPAPDLNDSTWSRFLQSFRPEQMIDSLKLD